jgi:hypothetical protein
MCKPLLTVLLGVMGEGYCFQPVSKYLLCLSFLSYIYAPAKGKRLGYWPLYGFNVLPNGLNTLSCPDYCLAFFDCNF